MGGFYQEKACSREHRDSSNQVASNMVHKVLSDHPKIRYPSIPKKLTPQAVAKYVTKYIAAYLSPTKIAGEDYDFRCEDVKDAIENKLLPEIIKKIEWEIVKENLDVK